MKFALALPCQSKLNCFIHDTSVPEQTWLLNLGMLFTQELKPTLNTQSDYIRVKLFLQREVFYIFFCRVLSYCYLAFFFSFYNLPFVTLSPYFIVFHILTWFYFLFAKFFIFFYTWKWSQLDRNVKEFYR